MKTLFLSVIICSLNVINSYAQKDVTIRGIVLSAPKPSMLSIKGNGLQGSTSVELWKLRTWQHYQKTKDSATYHGFYKRSGHCSIFQYNSSLSVTPGEFVFRVIDNYNNPSKQKETVKILDTRTEAQKNAIPEVFIEKEVNVNGFVLTTISPTLLKLTEPEYNESLVLELWEKAAWHKHLNHHRSNNFPRYSKVSKRNTEAGRTSLIKVIPGDYVLSLDLMNLTTKERTTHQKIINTEAGQPAEVYGDGFSLSFKPSTKD